MHLQRPTQAPKSDAMLATALPTSSRHQISTTLIPISGPFPRPSETTMPPLPDLYLCPYTRQHASPLSQTLIYASPTSSSITIHATGVSTHSSSSTCYSPTLATLAHYPETTDTTTCQTGDISLMVSRLFISPIPTYSGRRNGTTRGWAREGSRLLSKGCGMRQRGVRSWTLRWAESRRGRRLSLRRTGS